MLTFPSGTIKNCICIRPGMKISGNSNKPMIQKTKTAASPGELFSKFSNVYSPKIDLSIANFLDQKKKGAPHGFIGDMYALIKEYCLRKGKRMRPLVLLVSYSGYKKKKEAMGDIIKIASVLELMHSMLLIQDDIIDRSNMRRGGKTLHLVFQDRYAGATLNRNIGIDVAVVAADVLFANSVEIISGLKTDLRIKNEFLALFSETYESTAWGQILDSLHTRASRVDFENSAALQISTLKTAYYTIYYPMLMGYVLAGGTDAAERGRIRDFALPLGLAFQIRDDILGIFGEKESTGKSSESDIIEGKLTILIENALKEMDVRERRKFLAVFKKEKKSARELVRLRAMIENSGALESAGNKLRELTAKSGKMIDKLGVNTDAAHLLAGMIDLIETRKY